QRVLPKRIRSCSRALEELAQTVERHRIVWFFSQSCLELRYPFWRRCLRVKVQRRQALPRLLELTPFATKRIHAPKGLSCLVLLQQHVIRHAKVESYGGHTEPCVL